MNAFGIPIIVREDMESDTALLISTTDDMSTPAMYHSDGMPGLAIRVLDAVKVVNIGR